MAKFMVKGYKKFTRKLQESAIFNTYQEAFHEATDFLKSGQYKVITIVSDSEGADHPDNAGKFFLHRIIK